jgi:Family of unknown function (DUF5678)
MLEEEREYYEQNLGDWLHHYPGKYVAVVGKDVLGFFDTIDDALQAGARQVGLNSFLVRRVQEEKENVRIPALSLGIIYADSAPPIQ